MKCVRSVNRACGAGCAFLCLTLAGCSNGPFGESRIRFLLENAAIPLNGEQVQLSEQMFKCGELAELWEIRNLGPGRSIGKLLPAGRELKFSDDVQAGDMRLPYVQISGDFFVQLIEVHSIRDVDPMNKLVEAKVGVHITHNCFPTTVWLLGVHHGKFTEDFQPRFQFQQINDDWQYDSITHQ